MSTPDAEGVIRIFQALASEARICIVRELSDCEEKCVCDLVGCCGLGWSTVSHHLSILRTAGIVADEKRGKQVFYRLILPCVTDFIRCLEAPGCEPAPWDGDFEKKMERQNPSRPCAASGRRTP